MPKFKYSFTQKVTRDTRWYAFLALCCLGFMVYSVVEHRSVIWVLVWALFAVGDSYRAVQTYRKANATP